MSILDEMGFLRRAAQPREVTLKGTPRQMALLAFLVVEYMPMNPGFDNDETISDEELLAARDQFREQLLSQGVEPYEVDFG